MLKRIFIPLLLSLSLIVGIVGCKQSDKKQKKEETNQTDTTITPPYDSLPAIANTTEKKCFANDGLKFKVTVELVYQTDTSFTGRVISEDLGTNETEIANFSGKDRQGKLTVVFKDKAPAIGAASEWTDKPWTIKKSNASDSKSPDVLNIPVRAKNYDTNKWTDTEYSFDAGSCK